MQLYIIRVGLASRAEPAREPPSSRAEPGSSAHEMAEPSRARSATELHRAEPSLARFKPYPRRLGGSSATESIYTCKTHISNIA
jgi:hypothetical protein